MAQDLTYELINRQCFEYHSLTLFNRGWSIFPQTQDRKPASVEYKMINPIGEHNLDTRMPLLSDIERWNRKCGNQNLACMMGPGSGRAIAVDIDVLDKAKSEAAQALAKEILGYTPLQRVGRWPKIALIYRSEPEMPMISSKSYGLLDPDKYQQKHGLEILGQGKALTFFGSHHVTGRGFIWPEEMPTEISPKDIPTVNQAKINEFVKEFNQHIFELKMPGASRFGGRTSLLNNAVNADGAPENIPNILPFEKLDVKYIAPDKLDLAKMAYAIHAAKIAESIENKKIIVEDDDYIPATIMLHAIKRMIICGWKKDLIIKAAEFHNDEDETPKATRGFSDGREFNFSQSSAENTWEKVTQNPVDLEHLYKYCNATHSSDIRSFKMREAMVNDEVMAGIRRDRMIKNYSTPMTDEQKASLPQVRRPAFKLPKPAVDDEDDEADAVARAFNAI